MKNLLLAFLLVFSIKALAQSFEGTITWSIKTDITDPAVKAQMEESQKMMKDPATLKKMQEQMDNPQFKEMMEKNPQLKAQMEKTMAAMQSGGMDSMIPKGMKVEIKNGNFLTKMDGGIANNEVLYLKSQDKTYMLDPDNKTYSVYDSKPEENKEESKMDVKVTKTNEKSKVLNYTCTKYLVEIKNEEGTTIQQDVWATTDIKDIDFKSFAQHQMNKGKNMYFFSQIDGVPLKMVMNAKGATITIEATSIKKESLPASDFTVPADYKKTDM